MNKMATSSTSNWLLTFGTRNGDIRNVRLNRAQLNSRNNTEELTRGLMRQMIEANTMYQGEDYNNLIDKELKAVFRDRKVLEFDPEYFK